ncbi:hypothetical protein BDQ12DRAFT_450788 [Crucibulum laeve]|uniref:Uncharacterized protein n=1 Tax=Crucibulum laeve TaxID=68775 RepID=A0A5C3LIW5_9AGAR|nr:hypothetical protein BDQ12DRAFT_450788 [Crucibulum laeve]
MAPLAGRPPFATDEPDSFYESPPPQRRIRQPKPEDNNKRSSAYDVYDNYLDSKNPQQDNRQSGVGALGMGLLNMADSDDDSDDEHSYDKRRAKPTPAAVPAPSTPASKHAALAAALSPARTSPQPAPQPIAAPRPGYAAPIAALNLARPEAAVVPQGRQPPSNLRIDPNAQNPFEHPQHNQPQFSNPFQDPSPVLQRPFLTASPSPSLVSSTPHPLHPPITPITPVFARAAGVKFSEPIPRTKPIMRGNSEETLLPKRGEKGDDFWRRFSMVAKEESKKPSGHKESSWLRKTRASTNHLSRWVWIVGIVLIICIAGAIGLGLYISSKAPSHQAPKVFGGSANEAATGVPTAAAATGTAKGGASSSVLHVSPTHTVARRVAGPESTGVVGSRGNATRRHRNRMMDGVF